MVLDIQLPGGEFTNASACFSYPPEQQVACSSQFLNISEPPSEYDFSHYPFLWEPIACMLANTTYNTRVNVPDNFNFCSVPLGGSDAFLFAGLALVLAGCLFGKLSAVWVLVAGGIVGSINNYANLLQISNSISIWLGISPPDLFFYAFLPPLLVDSAIRIDFFMFSKLWVHIVLMAFVMVVLSAIVLTPLILFVLGFAGRGFSWVNGALIAAMIASTDALAATAILKQGGGPEKLVVLMEGEALLNDASAITLFEVFMHILEEADAHGVPTVWSAIPTIITETLKLASIGAGIGLAMSIATGYLLRWLRWRGARPPVELTVILAVAYLSFYVAQSPAKGSGVISVVVFGLWGNYTSKWGMLASTEESGAFDAFWDTLSFASNGLVFFWAGIASMNYFLRSINILGGNAWSYAAIPCIYVFMMAIRSGCLALFNVTAFRWIREPLSWAEVFFTGWAGLRGAISLIMTADFITHSAFLQGDADIDRVNSDIALWTAAFVLLTLLINAPTVSQVMHWLRLDRIPPEKQAMRAKAKRALVRFTGAAIDTLRDDDEEFLQGANWEAVSQYVDVSAALKKFDPPPKKAAQKLPPDDPSGGAGMTAGGAEEEGGEKVAAGSGQRKSLGRAVPGVLHSAPGVILSPLKGAAGLVCTQLNDGNKALASAVSAAAEAEEGAAFARTMGTELPPDQQERSRRSTGGGDGPGAGGGGEAGGGGKGGGGGLFGGLIRSPSFHQLAFRGGEGKERRQKERRQRRGRSSGLGLLERQGSRSARSVRTKSGYASDESSEDLSESDTSLRSSLDSDAYMGSEQSAGLLLGEVIEECPFLEPKPAATPAAAAVGREAGGRGRGLRRSHSSERDGQHIKVEAPRSPPGSKRPSMEQQQQQQAAQQAQQEGDIEMGLRPRAAAAAAALAAPAAAFAAPPPARPSPPAAPAAAAVPAAAGASEDEKEEEEEMTAEELAFMRRVQMRQRQQSQPSRPALGALFEPSPEAELPPGGSPRAVHRHGSSSQLATITENVQQAGEQRRQGWLQEPGPGSVTAASEGGGDELYYSSMPAEVGRQLQCQLQRQLAAGDGSAHPLPSPGAAAAADEAAAGAAAAAASGAADGSPPAGGPGGMLRSSPFAGRDEQQYYSSVPAAAGRQLGQQLRQQLASTPHRLATPGAAGDAPSPSPFSAAGTTQAPGEGGSAAGAAEPAAVAVGGTPPDYYSSVPAAVGRQMGRLLQAELAAAGAGPSAAAASDGGAAGQLPPVPASPRSLPAEDYYSSMPASLGRRMAAELQQARLAGAAGGTGAAMAQQAGQQAGEGGGDGDAQLSSAYYSSLPSAVGRSLHRQLQQELAAAVDASKQQEGQGKAQQQQQQVQQPSQPPPAARAGPPDAEEGHYSTMPASVGRSVQQRLSEELERQQGLASSGASRVASLEAGSARPPRPGAAGDLRRPPRPGGLPLSSSSDSLTQPSAGSAAAPQAGLAPISTARPKPPVLPPKKSQGRPSWEDYHTTVGAASGASLAAELQRQLAQRKAAAAAAAATPPFASTPRQGATGSIGPLTGLPQRDLLGRKIVLGSGPPSLGLASASLAPAGSGPSHSSAASASPASSLTAYPLPLSARASLHYKPGLAPARSGSLPRGAASPPPTARSILPAATPISEHLQARRTRMDLSRKTRAASAGAGSLDAAAGAEVSAAALEAAAVGAGSEEALARLQRRSGTWPHQRDTSWQHKPFASSRSMGAAHSTHLHSKPASRAASLGLAGLGDSGGSGEALPSPVQPTGAAAAGMASATLLSRTYSITSLSLPSPGGPGSAAPAPASNAKLGATGGAKLGGSSAAQRQLVLQRLSAHGSGGGGSLEPSQHGGGAYQAAAAGKDGTPRWEAPSSPRGAAPAVSEGALSEMRSRLIAGLKRYYHAKRMEGLLSSQGLRILDYACDMSAEHSHHRLGLWALLEREVKGNLTTRIVAQILLWLARSWRAAPHWFQAGTSWPVKKMSGFLRSLLGRRMLVSCEVAVEYYLSMLHSPQIQWMQQTDEAWPLQQEVDGEVDAAYRFIIGREIEAPDRFQAIQSYRAAMAVLRQQLTFVQELYESGMVDEGEKDTMVAPLDKRIRHLEITGPVWKPPRPRAVLRGLPFMQSIPDAMFKTILRAGSIKEYRTGEAFWLASDAVQRSGGQEGPGAFVVLSGVIRRQHVRPDGSVKEYFQGIGGVVGALLALTGTCLPGRSDMAVAEGNTLGKGPMLFYLPQSAVAWMVQNAEAGDPAAIQLRLQLLRLAGAFVLENCESDVLEAVQYHLVQLAGARAEHPRRRTSQHHSYRGPRHSWSAGHLLASPDGTGAPQQEAGEHSGYEEEEEEEEEEEGGQVFVPEQQTQQERRRAARRATAPASLPFATGLGQRRTTSLPAHHQHGHGHGHEEGEAGGAAVRLGAAKQQLQQQVAPSAPGGLRHSKSFGGHLADLMQQIAQEEFEELHGSSAAAPGPGQAGAAGGGAGAGAAGSRRLSQVEEGLEEDPLGGASEATTSLAGGSVPDLPGMAAAAAAGGVAAAEGGADEGAGGSPTNGFGGPPAPHHGRSRRSFSSHGQQADSKHLHKGAGSKGGHHGWRGQSRMQRHRVRTAARRAPQYAAEVLADLRRGLPFALLLELPAGASFQQTTHAVLLRGGLQAAGSAPSAALPLGPSPPHSPRASFHRKSSASVDAWKEESAGAALYRTSAAGTDQLAGGSEAGAGWEAALAAGAEAATAPQAPRILPWLWSARFRCSAAAGAAAQQHEAQAWRAGPDGAMLLVCLTDHGEVPEGVSEALESAAAAAVAAAAAADAEAEARVTVEAAQEGLRSYPLDFGPPSSAEPAGGSSVGGALAAPAQKLGQLGTRASDRLSRLMPWQHRYSSRRPAPAPGSEATETATGVTEPAASSQEGSGHGGSALRLLRAPLDLLGSGSGSGSRSGGKQVTVEALP